MKGVHFQKTEREKLPFGYVADFFAKSLWES